MSLSTSEDEVLERGRDGLVVGEHLVVLVLHHKVLRPQVVHDDRSVAVVELHWLHCPLLVLEI